MNNKDLKEAYDFIKDIYEKENIMYEYLDKITVSNKWNCIFTRSNNVGIAFNFTGEHEVYENSFNKKEFLDLNLYVGRNLFELIEHLLILDSLQMRSVCVAALNALSQTINTKEYFSENKIELLTCKNFTFIKPSDVVTLIGFGGVVNKIQGICKEFHVIDMRPKHFLRTLSIGDEVKYGPENIIFHNSSESKKILLESDIVIISGSTIVNGTYKDIIKNSKNARVIGMFGPSAQMVPSFLFKKGINYILSSKVNSTKGLYLSIMYPFHSNSFHENLESYAVVPEQIV